MSAMFMIHLCTKTHFPSYNGVRLSSSGQKLRKSFTRPHDCCLTLYQNIILAQAAYFPTLLSHIISGYYRKWRKCCSEYASPRSHHVAITECRKLNILALVRRPAAYCSCQVTMLNWKEKINYETKGYKTF